MNKKLSDLDRFFVLFDSEKCKQYPNKIECRVCNLDAGIAEANRIIQVAKLKLKVVRNGQLASFKAFDIVPADQDVAAAEKVAILVE